MSVRRTKLATWTSVVKALFWNNQFIIMKISATILAVVVCGLASVQGNSIRDKAEKDAGEKNMCVK